MRQSMDSVNPTTIKKKGKKGLKKAPAISKIVRKSSTYVAPPPLPEEQHPLPTQHHPLVTIQNIDQDPRYTLYVPIPPHCSINYKPCWHDRRGHLALSFLHHTDRDWATEGVPFFRQLYPPIEYNERRVKHGLSVGLALYDANGNLALCHTGPTNLPIGYVEYKYSLLEEAIRHAKSKLDIADLSADTIVVEECTISEIDQLSPLYDLVIIYSARLKKGSLFPQKCKTVHLSQVVQGVTDFPVLQRTALNWLFRDKSNPQNALWPPSERFSPRLAELQKLLTSLDEMHLRVAVNLVVETWMQDTVQYGTFVENLFACYFHSFYFETQPQSERLRKPTVFEGTEAMQMFVDRAKVRLFFYKLTAGGYMCTILQMGERDPTVEFLKERGVQFESEGHVKPFREVKPQ